MKYLTLPISAAKDEDIVNQIANDSFWHPHKDEWIAAYRLYQTNGGNPFTVNPHSFSSDIHEQQYKLYDNRKNSDALKQIRHQKGLNSCPVCGSPATGSLDHYLPRSAYPEFSIMRANLVPACGACNSGMKGSLVKGDDPQRFIHPYFDVWATQEIWYVEICPPYEAATFKPLPAPQLQTPHKQIVEFHLKNVLGKQFYHSMANEWSSLPGQLKLKDPKLTIASIKELLEIELRCVKHSDGENCWKAALIRGILRNNAAIKYLKDQALVAPFPP